MHTAVFCGMQLFIPTKVFLYNLIFFYNFNLTKSRSCNSYSVPSLWNLTNVSAAVLETPDKSRNDMNINSHSLSEILYLWQPSKPSWHGIHCRDYSGLWLIERQGEPEAYWMRLCDGFPIYIETVHPINIMMPWHGKDFHITVPVCWSLSILGSFPHIGANYAKLWCFLCCKSD